jgi:glycosyltransferase involved in cell wall biosynthesis
VPTYNEQADIRSTLEALLQLDYPELEVLVVDDSTDATPAIVREYEGDRLRLVLGPGRGRAAARNAGIRAARGEIVLVLNADVHLPRDMVRRILPHYAAGADYLLVESRVLNVERLYARYVQAAHAHDYGGRTWINWTEGFSCRRAAALQVGLFPEGAPVPLVSGEDGWFGENLEAAGCQKRFDMSIVVEHVAPAAWSEFVDKRLERGRGTAQILYMRRKYSLARLRWAWVQRTAYVTAYLLCVAPPLIYGLRLGRYSPRGRGDWLGLAWAHAVDLAFQQVGYWRGMREIAQAENGKQRHPDD